MFTRWLARRLSLVIDQMISSLMCHYPISKPVIGNELEFVRQAYDLTARSIHSEQHHVCMMISIELEQSINHPMKSAGTDTSQHYLASIRSQLSYAIINYQARHTR